MHTYIAPDEHPFLLYSSHPSDTLATDGLQTIVSRVPSTLGHKKVTFCGILGFPGIPALLPDREANQLSQVLITQVQDSYQRAPQGGLYALESVLNTLHQYVQFINRDFQAPIKGFASCAEIRERHLSLACSSGSLNVVLQQDAADIFPLSDPGHDIGTVGTLPIKTYEAELPDSASFFMGSDAWCTLGVASNQVGEARKELANAVAQTQSSAGHKALDFFYQRNPEHLMLGLLIGMPERAHSIRPRSTTFVPPVNPLEHQEAKTQPPEPPAANSNGDEQPERETTVVPGDLVMRSDVEADLPDTNFQALSWSGRISQRLMRWLSEIFPDPQASSPMPAGSRLDTSAVSARNISPPPIETVSEPAETSPNVEKLTKRLSTSSQRVQPEDLRPPEANRPWVAMMLLALIIVVPLASWLAFSINAEAPVASDINAVAQARQHVDKAKDYLADEQHEKAQKELQLASNVIQASQNTAGLSRPLQSLQMEIRLLWDDAFRLVPLVSLTDPLVRFTAEMTPSKVIVHIQDLYILDNRLHAVYKYRLDELHKDESHSPQLLVKEGDIIDGKAVGRIMDMSFQPTKTAYSDKPSLYLIDDNRNILQYNDTDLISTVDFGQTATWEKPILIDFYSNRMYVADAGKGQIWRYNLNNTVVKQEGWLNDSINLTHAIRMHVDDQIWMLFDNNTVLLFGQGEDDSFPSNVQKPFGVQAAISFDSRFTDLEVGPNQDHYLLLTDSGLSSILVLDKENGDYQHQLVAPEGGGDIFANLTDVYVHRGKIYILTADSLYEHSFSS